MTSARNLSRGLLPSFDSPEDLRAAVYDLLAAHSQRHGIEFSCDIADTVRTIRHNGMLHLFRIIQEATNNAVKHGCAKNISVSINCHQGLHALTVKGDGRGVLPAAGPGHGMGKLIMKQRARIIGASLSFSGTEEGSLVQCCWQNGGNESI